MNMSIKNPLSVRARLAIALPALLVGAFLLFAMSQTTSAETCSARSLTSSFTQVTDAKKLILDAQKQVGGLRGDVNTSIANMVVATLKDASSYMTTGDPSAVLRQVSRGDLLSIVDADTIVDAAIDDARSSGISLTAAQITTIRTAAAAELRAQVTPVVPTDAANIIAKHIVTTTGVGSVPTIAAALGGKLPLAFERAVTNAISQEITKGLVGSLDTTAMKGLVASSVSSVTGYAGSVCSGSGDTYTCGDIASFLNTNLSADFMGALVPIQDTLKILNTMSGSLTSALGAVNSAISNVSSAIEGVTSLVCSQISSIVQLAGSIDVATKQIMTQVAGPLTSAIGGFSSAATSFLTTGDPSAMLGAVSGLNATLTGSSGFLKSADATLGITSGSILAESITPGGGLDLASFTPFGGTTSVFPCTCSGNYRITVGSPRPGVFMYQPGFTIEYENYNALRSGVWALGLAQNSLVQCWVPSGWGCSMIGAHPPIYIIGTSM